MDEKSHQIDPDGDVELTLRDADPTFAAWDDNERVLISHPRDLPVHNRISKLQTKSRTEERTIEKPNAYASFNLVDPGRGSVPAPEYYTYSDDESENGSENEPETEDLLPESSTAFEDMPRSDGEAELMPEEPSATSRSTTPQPEKKEEIRMKLSSKHLVLASNYFRKMFVGPWKESISSSGKCHTVDATGWDTEAMLILMNIIHGRARKVPRSIDLEMLAKIATLVDYYDCHEVVILYAECWIRELDTELPNDYGRDLVLWLWISWVFGREIIFETMTRIATLECRGPLQTLGLPIPQHIVETLDQQRQEVIGQIISGLGYLVSYFHKREKCTFECSSILLGALSKHLRVEHLLSLKTKRPFLGYSIAATTAIVQGFQSPTWYSNSSGSLHYRHSCTLSAFTDSTISSLGDGIAGLKLENFHHQ
ncbi:hypothetical protein AB5N19_12630 [Seiridium cardinale]